MEKNKITKELFKSKIMSKFSHYVSGNLYYTVELSDGSYQFPISTIEKIHDGQFGIDLGIKLSSDLGTTAFHSEVRGSELNRWISKAIDSNEFIKII